MKKSILFIFTACFLFTTSCSDFLDEEHKTKYSSEYVFGTPEGLKLAVNALYALQRYYANDTENATIFALERGTDLAVTNGGTGNFYGIYDPNYLKPSASQVGFMWRTMYQIIGKANEIIAAAEDLEDTPSLRATVSEAKCFRAQSYFLLYRTFDRIWLNIQPTTAEKRQRSERFSCRFRERSVRLDLRGFGVCHYKPRLGIRRSGKIHPGCRPSYESQSRIMAQRLGYDSGTSGRNREIGTF